MRKTRNRLGWLLAVTALTILALILTACQTATPETINTVTAAPTATEPALLKRPLQKRQPLKWWLKPRPPLSLKAPPKPTPACSIWRSHRHRRNTPAGEMISMHYIATLPDGTELANTYTKNGPVRHRLGPQNPDPGLGRGLGLMKIGGKAKLVIPSELALAKRVLAAIPPNSPADPRS